MTTQEIISAFMKGNTKVAISDKQKAWLFGQAKKEGLNMRLGGPLGDCIYFTDHFYSIKQGKRLASGGSYVGSKVIPNRYNVEKLYLIRFADTGYKEVANDYDLERLSKDYTFEIINPFQIKPISSN